MKTQKEEFQGQRRETYRQTHWLKWWEGVVCCYRLFATFPLCGDV